MSRMLHFMKECKKSKERRQLEYCIKESYCEWTGSSSTVYFSKPKKTGDFYQPARLEEIVADYVRYHHFLVACVNYLQYFQFKKNLAEAAKWFTKYRRIQIEDLDSTISRVRSFYHG